MGYTLKGLDKLELTEGFRYIPNELDAFDGDILKGKVHSSQLLPRKEKNPKDNFELRKNDKDTINIKDLSIYKSQDGTMNDSQISFRFIIPAFQRGYRWETEKVRELLEDIYINYKKYYNPVLPDEIESYCIQPLVLKQSTNLTGFLNEFRVIDGQQRLTTITLLLEALNNQVPEETKFHAFIPISYETRPESEIFLYKVGEVCKNAIKSVKENVDTVIPLEERVDKTLSFIDPLPKDLNTRYMLNTYLYAYWFFWEIITGNRKDYFEFAEAGWDKGEDWKPKRFALIVKMLLKATSVIWYKIENDDEDEHKVFEDFNSGKISLTGSELVKGVFMNPDNYIDNYQDYSFNQLKTNQAMLGGQWDDMEKTLHNEEFWSFIPHQEDGAGEIDKSTHIDSILNMYVFFKIMCGKNASKIIDDDLFTYKEINKKIKEINKKTSEKLSNSEDKFKSMWNIWLEIKSVYTTFHEWFIGDNSLKKINSLYHRISLFKRIFFNKQDSYTQRYQRELACMYLLYDKLTTCDKKAREKFLNKYIAKELLNWETDDSMSDDPKSDDIENFIKTRTYNENDNDVKVILLAFNLSTLEGAKAYGGRFPFNIFDKEKWNSEHIFATHTELSGEDDDEKELYDALVSENEMNSYEEYHKLINKPVKESYEKTIEEINSIINGHVSGRDKDSLNTKLLNKEDGDILANILRDNHMGNMALLTARNNISISNDSYKDKSEKIKKWFMEGEFIPICTMNVFSDFYSDDDGYSTHWLYAKRITYLNQMIKSVNNYLFGNETDNNEDMENG